MSDLQIPGSASFAAVRVSEIWRFPVKSLGGETVESARLDGEGIEGDRAWGLYDPAADRVLTARREPALLFLSAKLVDGSPVVTCDDGSTLADDAALSTWLGRPVELRAAAAGTASFEAPLDEEGEADWVSWSSSGGTFHDGRSKVSLVSESTLGAWDRRRFRLNVVLDEPGDDQLSGDVRVGTATLTIRKPIDRCIMVTRAQPGLGRDLEVLKRVRDERANQLGIGAVVTTPGTIHVGDPVTEFISRLT